MSGFTTFTPEQSAAAPQLEPSFEMTLRAADISEEGHHWFSCSQDQDCRDICCDRYYCGRTQRNSSQVERANIHNALLAVKVNQ